MKHQYVTPGTYVAICNKINWDGHYVKIFDFPVEEAVDGINASWYFLNRVDFTACVEAVYPIEIFEKAQERRKQTQNAESSCSDRWSIGVNGEKVPV